MTRIRVVSIEVDLAPGEHLPAGFGDFLGTITEPEAGAPVLSSGTAPAVAAPAPAAVAEAEPEVTAPPPHPRKPARVRLVSATSKAPSKPLGPRAARTEAIREKLRAGEDKAAIAEEFGITVEAVRLHEKKLGRAPAPTKEAKALPTYRCQECGQRGYDPKRCDHCQERRAK